VEGVAIVVNVPQRMLFYSDAGKVSCAFPIAAGKADWKTPLGDFEIIEMEENPTWDVPPSIQEEMRQAGKPVLTRVPPSPENPLGQYWMRLSLPGIGIHGTNAPSSIYKLATHGCIRLHPDDVRSLFFKVDVGTRGKVIYEPLLIAVVGTTVFVEIHPDAYRKQSDALQKALNVARSEGFVDMLDMALLKEAIRKRDGIARDISRR
jgi:L,D-transpeptidase ErfK/SrfK